MVNIGLVVQSWPRGSPITDKKTASNSFKQTERRARLEECVDHERYDFSLLTGTKGAKRRWEDTSGVE